MQNANYNMDSPPHRDVNVSNGITAQLLVEAGEEDESVLLPADIVPEERTFDTIEEVNKYVKDYMKRAKNGIVIQRSCMNPTKQMYRQYGCEYGLKYSTHRDWKTTKRQRQGKTRRRKCPFSFNVAFLKRRHLWKLVSKCSSHNHLPADSPTAFASIRRRTPETRAFLHSHFSVGITEPRILKKLLADTSFGADIVITDKDISNERQAFMAKQKDGQSTTTK